MLGESPLPAAGNDNFNGESDMNHFMACSLKSSSDLDLGNLVSSTNGAAGWTLFFSLVVLLYHIFALLQMFFYLEVLYMKIRLGKSLWYLFSLIVSTN